MSELRKGEKGQVLEIIRMSTEDGPGLRTTVFLKGCPLHCSWCHNPESISPKPEIQWIGARCIGCLSCVDACHAQALEMTDNGMRIDRQRCDVCGRCVNNCPSTAMELMGEGWRAETLVQELLKDRAYFEQSGDGGITLSGGEVTLQSEFAAEVLTRLKAEGLHTAIDTCGYCAPDRLSALLPLADLVLFDLKEADETRHKQFTGVSLKPIRENLARVVAAMRESKQPAQLWIRTPIIPGKTANAETISGIGKLIAEIAGDAVARWDLCAFNNLCRDKYTRLGQQWEFADTLLLTERELEALAEVARQSGVNPAIVIASGSTRLSDDESKED